MAAARGDARSPGPADQRTAGRAARPRPRGSGPAAVARRHARRLAATGPAEERCSRSVRVQPFGAVKGRAELLEAVLAKSFSVASAPGAVAPGRRCRPAV